MKATKKEQPLKMVPSNADKKDMIQPSGKNLSGINETPPSRPDTSSSLFSMRDFHAETDLPIVYNPDYNMSMIGIEMLHQFDTKKYSKMADYLNELFQDTPFAKVQLPSDGSQEQSEQPQIKKLVYLTANRPVNKEELSIHHTSSYVERIHSDKSLIARITETWALNLAPLSSLETRLLNPLKLQVAGTIFAAHLAMQHGWAINLGGGFHQASADDGETFCLFSDIALAMKYIWRKHPLQKYMVIDLDAHQATGLERDIQEFGAKRRKMVYMLDIYNETIHPPDPLAEKGADLKVALGRFTGDETYLSKLESSLKTAEKFKPSLIFYNAGQDILKDDQLGLMNISDQGLIKRDEIVFTFATEKLKCPIVMLMSGGYINRGQKVQMDSIRHLWNKGLIWSGHRSSSRSLSRPKAKGVPEESSKSKGSTSKSTSKTLHKKLSGSKSMTKKVAK